MCGRRKQNPFFVFLSGDPIACINDGAVPNHVINTYCWITYTFTLPGQHGNFQSNANSGNGKIRIAPLIDTNENLNIVKWIGKHVGTEVAQSGLGNDNQEKTFHSYYQWVPFVLFFQVSSLLITFRIRVLWRNRCSEFI